MDANPHVVTDRAALRRLRGKAHGFTLLPRQPVRSLLSGQRASRLRGRGLDFEELRHYRIGDDVRTIDWKVTNRTGKPHVRIYTEERDRPCFIVVDQRPGMFFGSQWKMKSVVAAEAAALAAWRVLDAADRVGGLVFNDRDLRVSRPQRSESAVLGFFRQIEDYNHALAERRQPETDTPLSLTDVLRRTHQLCPHDHLIVLVSDFAGWNDDTTQELRRLAQHNDLVAIHVSDPLERELPQGRSFVVSQDGQQIEADARRLGSRYREAFVAEAERIQAELRRHHIPVLPIDAASEVAPQVRTALQTGGGSG